MMILMALLVSAIMVTAALLVMIMIYAVIHGHDPIEDDKIAHSKSDLE